MDLSKLTPEEQALLASLVTKAEGEGPVRGYAPPVPKDRAFGEAPPPNPPQVQRLPSPEDWVSKQIGNLSAVGEANYRQGITRPKKDPIAAGIAAQDKYAAKMRDPAVLARRAEALKRTNMDEWASMAERLGASRLVEGVTTRQFKVERFVGAFQPKLATHLREIDALPAVTDADRERRMLENLRGLRKLKGVR